ncbi:MAG: archaetidylserine decarboxylase [Gammaproteobacteria bacterium]
MQTSGKPSINDWIKSLPLYILPHHALSRGMMALTRIRLPWFKNWAINQFSNVFDINWSDAKKQRADEFENFNAFFTRELRSEVRPIDAQSNVLVSPADGRVSQIGNIDAGTLLQAKGKTFTTQALLGGVGSIAAPFDEGSFTTIYLSPRDYHRLHMPCDGTLIETIYIPGRLFSVAPHTTRTIPGLFARNERLVALFETEHGKMALVLVGAIFVSAIETVWAGLVTPPHQTDCVRTDYRQSSIVLKKGEELGRFNMGSTIIALFEKNRVVWAPSLSTDSPVKMGQAIATGYASG